MTGFYKEHQRFTQWWFWAIIAISTLPLVFFFAYGLYIQLVLNEPWGDQPMSDTGLIIAAVTTSLIIGGIIWLFFTAELTIEVHDRAIYYRFTPFIAQNRRIGIDELVEWEVNKFRVIADFGGYGWRKGLGGKTAYNVKGNMGLNIQLTNGKKLLLGTQKPDELRAAIQFEIDKMSDPDFR